jgi:hypothetical protein
VENDKDMNLDQAQATVSFQRLEKISFPSEKRWVNRSGKALRALRKEDKGDI